MPTISVGAPGTLAEVLGIHGVQPWRADYLAACGQITVRRSGSAIDIKTGRGQTPLQRQDEIIVPDPLPLPCASFPLPASGFRDYALVAFADPNDQHIARLREFFDNRAQTVRLTPPSNSLKEFIDMLKGNTAVTHPIRELHIGSHASPHGAFAVHPAPGVQRQNTTFEVVDDAVGTRIFELDPALLTPRPRDPNTQQEIPARFIIRGCGIGQAKPFLVRLKQALGGGLQVVAPKFEHAFGTVAGPRGTFLYEFLAYEFYLYRPRTLASDQAIITALIAEGFKDVDGQPIQNREWARWVPVGSPPQNRTTEVRYTSRFNGRAMLGKAFFSMSTEEFPGGEFPVNAPQDPGTETARLQLVETFFNAKPTYQSSHAFPFYERLGYKSLAAMLAGHSWTFRYDSNQQKLYCKAERVAYTVHWPITDASGQLIHNVFPIRPAGPPSEMFKDTDTKFFEAV